MTLSPMRPFQFYHNAVRAKEIVTTLASYGFDELLSHLNLPTRWLRNISGPVKSHPSSWENLRLVCEDLGSTFIKIAQALSARPNILPRELIHEFNKLKTQTPAEPFESIKELLDTEFGQPIENIFSEFDREAFAGGSLAQIHRARLKSDGRSVVVKVQRPGIRRDIEADLEILRWFARRLHEKVAHLKPYNLPELLDEIGASILKELDFTVEASNATYFNKTNPHPETTFAPKVVEELSGKRILVTELVIGHTVDAYQGSPESRRRIAQRGGASIFRQILIDGFFHADPHGGNLILTPDDTICFLDWGTVGQLTRSMRYFLADLLVAIRDQNPEAITRTAINMFPSSRRVNKTRLEKQIMVALHQAQKENPTEFRVGELVLELLYLFGSHGIHIGPDYVALAKSIVLIEDVATRLDPDYDIIQESRPFVRQLILERYQPSRLVREGVATAKYAAKTWAELPEHAQRVLRRIEEDELKIHLEHSGLQKIRDSVDVVGNRLSLALIIAALIVGSSIVITTGIQPFLYGYPAIGIVGFLISGLLGLWIVIDILRNNLHR